MKILLTFFLLALIFSAKSQASLVSKLDDGRYMLSNDGASYFAKLSLDCANKPAPHYFYKALRVKGEERGPSDLWPSF